MPMESERTKKTKQDSDYANNLRKKGKKTIALVSIRDAEVIEGSLPRVLMHRVLGWCVSHTKELLVCPRISLSGYDGARFP